MVIKFASYKLCKLFGCLMCLQMFFVCINHFPQFTFSHNYTIFTWPIQECKRVALQYL
jgi:hypothetical protein